MSIARTLTCKFHFIRFGFVRPLYFYQILIIEFELDIIFLLAHRYFCNYLIIPSFSVFYLFYLFLIAACSVFIHFFDFSLIMYNFLAFSHLVVNLLILLLHFYNYLLYFAVVLPFPSFLFFMLSDCRIRHNLCRWILFISCHIGKIVHNHRRDQIISRILFMILVDITLLWRWRHYIRTG